jgi:predicted nucleotidyltransferase
MHRDEWTKKLARIVSDIEAGKIPVPVQKLYVFGSYARGALEPKDLDLIVIHEKPSSDLMEELQKKADATARTHWDHLAGPQLRLRGLVSKALRRPAENIDILVGPDLQSVFVGRPLTEAELVLLWSANDRDWQTKIFAISVDPLAGPAARSHFISPKYAQMTVEAVEHTTGLLEQRILVLTRIPVETMTGVNCSFLGNSLAIPRRVFRWGKKTQKVLPYAISWLKTQKATKIVSHEQGELWDEQRRCRVQIGPLYFSWMTSLFEDEPGLQYQCLIPHFRRDYAKELLVFERGPSWEQSKNRPIMP